MLLAYFPSISDSPIKQKRSNSVGTDNSNHNKYIIIQKTEQQFQPKISKNQPNYRIIEPQPFSTTIIQNKLKTETD